MSGWLPGVLNHAVMPVKFGARPRSGRFVLLAMNTAGFCGEVAGAAPASSWSSSSRRPGARSGSCPVSVAAHVAFFPSSRALAAANWFWCSPLRCRSWVQAELVDSMWSSSAVV